MPPRDNFRSIALILLLAAAAGVFSACSTVQPYGDQLSKVYEPYRQGNPDRAAELITGGSYDRRMRSNDRLLWHLEAGKILHAAGDYQESNRYFEKSEEIIVEFEERADINVRAGLANIGALATNPAALPYQGSYAERIMVNTYKAMNFMAMGNLEGARVELRRAYERQRQAVEENDAAISDAERRMGAHKLTARQTYDNPDLQKTHGPIDPALSAAYGDFSNPFTTFLSGVVYIADEDFSEAAVAFRILSALPLQNGFVDYDNQLLQEHLDGEKTFPRRRVYVVFENGRAPGREEMRVDLILPEIGYTGFSFPGLAYHPSSVGALAIGNPSSGTQVLTEQIASVDQIIAVEFQTRMPAMVARTVLSFIGKEVVSKKLRDELDGWGVLLGSLYKAVTNRPDTRSWLTLGKEFQVASLGYPDEGVLRVALMSQYKNEPRAEKTVALPDGEIILVLARSIGTNDLHVTVSTLR